MVALTFNQLLKRAWEDFVKTLKQRNEVKYEKPILFKILHCSIKKKYYILKLEFVSLDIEAILKLFQIKKKVHP